MSFGTYTEGPEIKVFSVSKVSSKMEAKSCSSQRWRLSRRRREILSQNYGKFLPPVFDSPGRANSHGWLVAQATDLAGHFAARRQHPCEFPGRGSQDRSSAIWPITSLPRWMCLSVPALGSNVELPWGSL